LPNTTQPVHGWRHDFLPIHDNPNAASAELTKMFPTAVITISPSKNAENPKKTPIPHRSRNGVRVRVTSAIRTDNVIARESPPRYSAMDMTQSTAERTQNCHGHIIQTTHPPTPATSKPVTPTTPRKSNSRDVSRNSITAL